MPPLTSKQKLTMGLYVGLLTLVILLLWAYFLKFEFKQVISEKPEEAAWFAEVKKEFGQIASSSKNFLNQAKKNLAEPSLVSPTTTGQATTTLSAEAKQLLLDKAKQELEKNN